MSGSPPVAPRPEATHREETGMPTYLIINEHRAEDCEPMEAGMDRLPEHLRGQDFYCTCPYGKHGFYMILEGESSEAAAGGLPPELLMGSARAGQLEVFKLPG
jgi:hypothetical protein